MKRTLSRSKLQASSQADFDRLCADAWACRACPWLADRRAVIGPAGGTLSARVVFVGEAPGRRGAERTGRSFQGDASGDNFEKLLHSIGLGRDDVFVTNAVLCCPADERRNRPPTVREIRTCLPYLIRTLELIRPAVVATVGAAALKAMSLWLGRPMRLSEQVGRRIADTPWPGCTLVPLYHPSPRVMHTVRDFHRQQRDWQTLSDDWLTV